MNLSSETWTEATYTVKTMTAPETGIVIAEAWKIDGQLHREGGGPAHILRNAITGAPYLEEWYIEGQLHRKGGGPARILRNSITGAPVLEEWYIRGQLHRENGQPARITYDQETGNILTQEWYRKGRQFTPRTKNRIPDPNHSPNRPFLVIPAP